MVLKNIFLVGLGGFLGSVARYLVCLASTNATNTKALFPWGTFGVNIIGCLLIGFFWGLMDTCDWFSEEFRLFVMVGFCGGFTTFSSYALDGVVMGKVNLSTSFLYLSLSVILGMACIFLGHFSSTRLWG